MVGKLLLFMVSFFGVMASGPALAILAILVLKPDVDRILAQHGTMFSVVFALYMAFAVFMFFSLQDRFIVFRPEPGKTPLSKTAVLALLEESFARPTTGGKLFDFMAEKDRVVITWSSSLDYFQVTNVGGRGMKRVIVLTLDEGSHEAFFIMKDKDWRWNVSKNFFSLSLSYSTGISAEFETEVYPSIVFSETGGLKVDLKKLKYSSNDLWNPIQAALLSSGWTLRGGMMPKFYQRVLVALPVAIVCLAFCMLVTGGFKSAPKTSVPKAPESREPGPVTGGGRESSSPRTDRPQPPPLPKTASPLERMAHSMAAEDVRIMLQGIMNAPPGFLDDKEKLNAFVVYANGYLAKPDRKEDFSVALRKFAAKKGLELRE